MSIGMHSAFQTAVELVVDVLFPRACGLCASSNLRSGHVLCDLCDETVKEAMRQPYCPRCGVTVGPYGGTENGCPSCRTHRLATAGFARVGAFAGDLAELVRLFKFRGAEHLDLYVAHLLSKPIRCAAWFEDVDVLTWVPTCWQHRLKRRFHAASALAPPVGRETGLRVLVLLRRVAGGPHQVGLSTQARAENVKGKFRAVRGVALNGATVCLLDDVATTGATMDECARALKRAGAGKVYAAVVARAGGFDHIPKDA